MSHRIDSQAAENHLDNADAAIARAQEHMRDAEELTESVRRMRISSIAPAAPAAPRK